MMCKRMCGVRISRSALQIITLWELVFLLTLGAAPSMAQTIAGAVLARREPHHHLAYEDSTIRVLRVRVPAHDTTLLHEHQFDYFWIGVGSATVVNARPGLPDATLASPDLAFHFTPGNFAHVARNPGDMPFDNITVELLTPQTGARNLCESAVNGKPLDCAPPSAPTSRFFVGGEEHRAFATDQLLVSLVTIPPGATVRPLTPAHTIWLIALDSMDVGRGLRIAGAPKWVGGTSRGVGSTWTVENRSRKPVRVLAVIGRRISIQATTNGWGHDSRFTTADEPTIHHSRSRVMTRDSSIVTRGFTRFRES